jgi:hypothetical protein
MDNGHLFGRDIVTVGAQAEAQQVDRHKSVVDLKQKALPAGF